MIFKFGTKIVNQDKNSIETTLLFNKGTGTLPYICSYFNSFFHCIKETSIAEPGITEFLNLSIIYYCK
jgi:hypothetical protein